MWGKSVLRSENDRSGLIILEKINLHWAESHRSKVIVIAKKSTFFVISQKVGVIKRWRGWEIVTKGPTHSIGLARLEKFFLFSEKS